MAIHFSSHSARLGGHQIHAHLIHTSKTVKSSNPTWDPKWRSRSKKMQKVYHVHKMKLAISHPYCHRHLEKSMFSYLVDGIACGCSPGVSSLDKIGRGRITGMGWNRSNRISQGKHKIVQSIIYHNHCNFIHSLSMSSPRCIKMS